MNRNLGDNPAARTKMWLWLFLLIVIIIGFSFFIWRYYPAIKAKFNSRAVNSEISSLTDQLIGPLRTTRAAELKPSQVIYWTNHYRGQYGLQPLRTNDKLTQAAQKKTDDMFQKQYFEHVSPSGVSPAQLVASVGYEYKTTGENLALGDFQNEKELVDAWMNSPGHRANILNKDYTEIGVATGLGKYQDRPETWIAVQEFGKPLPQCSKPDASILNDINAKKAQIDTLNNQIKNLPAGTTQEQANTLIQQAQALANEISSESDQYNSEVNVYNVCIAS